jgi:hypothetical protein
MNASTHWSCVAMKLIHAEFEYPARMPIISYCFRTRARMEQYPAATVRLKAEGKPLAAVGAFLGGIVRET